MSICLEFPAAAKHLQIAEEACGMATTLEEQTKKKKKKNGKSGFYLFLRLIWYVMLLFIYFS